MSNNLPFGMMPVRTADAPKKTDLGDCTIYEYPIIGAVALADDRPWEPIVLSRRGKVLRLMKPRVGVTSVQAQGTLTDQFMDFRYTVFALQTEVFPEEQTPQPLELYQAIYELSHLIRTVARQYWIGFAMANEGSVVQATRTRIESGIATFFGQGSFSAPIIVSALTEDSWRFLGLLLSLPAFPSTAEVMLCDALLEIRRGDLLQAVLLLGVASEVLTIEFLHELISRAALSNTKKDNILNASFKQKFLIETVGLGVVSPEGMLMPGFPKGWAQTVCELYRLRNQAAHGGTCVINDNGNERLLEMRDISKYLFSVEALFCWVSRERNRLGIPNPVTATMLPGGYPVRAVFTPGT